MPSQITVSAQSGFSYPLAYLESMIIPAAAQRITLKNEGKTPCKLVLVQVRPGIGKTQALNQMDNTTKKNNKIT